MNAQQNAYLEEALSAINQWWLNGDSACDTVEFVESQILKAMENRCVVCEHAPCACQSAEPL
jgi:hypothetical protein